MEVIFVNVPSGLLEVGDRFTLSFPSDGSDISRSCHVVEIDGEQVFVELLD